MGSLTSRPKVKSLPPQIVYVPAPAPDPESAVAASTAGGSNSTITVSQEKTPSEIRTNSLLSRDRSRFGTILTSFRGLLDLAGNNNKRKTLLGE